MFTVCFAATNTGQVIKIGDLVRVRPSVTTPRYKWGSVTHRSIGAVTCKLLFSYITSSCRHIKRNNNKKKVS